MADPQAAPDINPFDQFKQADSEAPEQNPFEQFKSLRVVQPQDETSAVGAFRRGVERSAFPAIASFPAIGAGAEVGAEVAAPFTPIFPPAPLVGALVGGAATGLGAGYALSKAQNWALNQLPDKWKDTLGLSDRQEKLDEGDHPVASFLGGLLPYALTMRPGMTPTTALPENATALQRLMAHPVTARLFGGTAMGGIELGQEKVEDDKISWPKVMIATAFGTVFNRPTQFGERLTELGAAPTRGVLGRPSPTLAQAADAKVMGPGVTEDVFHGSQTQDPAAQMTAQETARQEQSVLNPQPEADVHEAARRMHPELFAHYDDLLERQRGLQAWLDKLGAEAAPGTQKYLADTNAAIGTVAPEISAAYRRAAEAIGALTSAPQERFPTFAAMLAAQGEGAPAEGAARSIEQQRDFIRNDVAQKLIAAGRPAEEAEAAGALISARYETRAARFNGALGNAEELYKAEGPEIVGRVAGAPPAAAPSETPPPAPTLPPAEAMAPVGPRGPAARDENTFSLLEFLARRGGIRSDDTQIADLRQSFGGQNRFVPGFGQLIRSPRQLSTAARAGGRYAPMSLDTAREAAEEAGYLPRGASINDLLEAVDGEARGSRVYREGYLPENRSKIADENDHARDRFLTDLDQFVSESGSRLTRKERTRAIEIWQHEGLDDHAAILERLFLEARDDAVDSGVTLGEQPIAIPGWDDAVGVGPPRTGELVSPLSGQEGAAGGGAGRTGGEGAREEAEEYFQRRKRPRDLIAEREAEGQLGLPGTERIGQGELAQRKANEPLKPSVEQKPMDEGLFSDQAKQKELFQAPIYYSAAARAIESFKQDKASADQWLGMLKNTLGVKPEELEWLGLADWLKEQKGAVTRDAVLDYVRANQIEVKEVEKGETPTPAWIRAGGVVSPTYSTAKFPQYTLPGGENYRELLLTLPENERVPIQFRVFPTVHADVWQVADQHGRNFLGNHETRALAQAQADEFNKFAEGDTIPARPNYKSPHWDEPNVLAHIRFDDRDGGKTLHIAEIQSDWHQKGRKEGYVGRGRSVEEIDREIDELRNEAIATRPHLGHDDATAGDWQKFWDAHPEMKAQQDALYRERGGRQYAVPDAPFKTTWPELSLKRMIRYAAENGYDRITWDTGDTNAERYDLSKQVESIKYTKGQAGTTLDILTKDGDHIHKMANGAELADLVGKEIADKIASGEHDRKWGGVISGELEGGDLKVGGEGMRGFYDKMLPAAANKLVKKFGGKVEYAVMPKPRDESGSGVASVHSLEITPQLREAAVEQGFPLFQGAQGKVRIRPDAKPLITLMQSADASTFIHESGHVFLEELLRDAEHPQAPSELKNDAATALQWLGAASAEEVKTRQHEKFARGFEQYLREGVAPSPELASVFGRFREWLLRIYQSLRGLGPQISDDIRGVFDRMLAERPQRTVIAPERMNRPTLADIHEADAAHTEPHEAEPAADRVTAEKESFIANLPGGINAELRDAAARHAAAAEAPTGAERSGQVGQNLAGPGTVAAGGAGGAEPGAVEPRGGATLPKGAGERPAGEQPRGASEPDAALGDKPLAPRPRESISAGESKFTDKAGNIRLENLTSEEDVKDAIRESAKENEDFIGERRGIVSDGQVMDLAADLGMEGAEKLVRERVIGQAFNAEQIVALRKLLIQSAGDVAAAMKKANGGADADVMAYAQAKARHQMIQGTVAQATAEAGRALRAFRDISGAGAQGDFNAFIKQATGKTLFQLRQEAALGATLQTPQQISKFLMDAQKKNFGRMILEYWINGLISGPVTHTTYMVGNTLLALEKAGPETAMASAIGSIRRALGREGETVRIGEVGRQLRAAGRNLSPAMKAALDALRTGVTTALPGEAETQNILRFPGTELAEPALLEETAKLSDVMESAYGVVRGLRDGFLAGGALSGAEEPLANLRWSHLGSIPDIELRQLGVALPLGSAVRIPSRVIAGIHSFFRAVNYSMNKAADAYRVAANEGLNGTAMEQRIAELSMNPSAEKMEAYRGEANELTLMGQGGAITQRLSALINTPFFAAKDAKGNAIPGTGFPILKFIDPFVHISSNIINQSLVARSPLGILSPEIRADLMGRNGNIAQDMAMAKMLMGTLYAIGLGSLAAEGYVSGSEPPDPHQAAMWRLAGNQAHSVRVGDVWYDVHRLGPLGMLLGIAADLYDVSHLASSGDMVNAASHLQHAITQNVLDESFMRGPADLIQAIEDPARYGERYIRDQLSSFLPYSVGMGQMARASDPYSRQARTVMDEIRAKVPGMSESLFPRRDIWGEPIPNKTAIGTAAATAIWEQRMSADPVNRSLYDLGIYPAALTRKIRNVQLDDQQYDDYQRIAGRMTKMRLDVIVNSPDYRAWPNHIKANVIREVIAQSREAARGVMLGKYPTIARDATQLRLQKLTGGDEQ